MGKESESTDRPAVAERIASALERIANVQEEMRDKLRLYEQISTSSKSVAND